MVTFNYISEDILKRWEVAAVCLLQHFSHLADFGIPQLLINTVKVLGFCLPEFNLHQRCWVESFKKWLSRILLENISDLMSPFNDDRFNGMDKTSVVRFRPVFNLLTCIRSAIRFYDFKFEEVLLVTVQLTSALCNLK